MLNCHDSVIYVLGPLRYATIYGCSDATIVLGAVGKVSYRDNNSFPQSGQSHEVVYLLDCIEDG